MKKQTSQPKPKPLAVKLSSKAKVTRPPKKTAIVPLAEDVKESRSYWRKKCWYILGFAVAVVVFAGLSWLVYKHRLFAKDYYIFRLINDWPEKLRLGFVAVTTLGSIWAAAVSVVLTFVLRLYQLAWRLALSTCTAYGLLLIVKEIFARPRPESVMGDIHVRVLEASFAFPSAHTTIATVLALTLRSYLPIPAIWQWLLALICIAGVGLSRVYLGVHTPLDVAAGFALGAGIVCFWQILPPPLSKILRLK